MTILEGIKLKGIICQKVISRIIILPATERTSTTGEWGSPIASDMKRYEEIRKLTPGQGDDYTTGFFLDYYYSKNH